MLSTALNFFKSKRRFVILATFALLCVWSFYGDLSILRLDGRGDGFRAIERWRKGAIRKHESEQLWMKLAMCLQEAKPAVAPPHHGAIPPEWVGKVGGPNYKVEMTAEESAYIPGERGIVTTAGGHYVPIFLVSLRLLRRTGSNLPVEVFLANDAEYEPYFCDTILPSLNARCRVLSRELGAVPSFTLESYQFKIFSILFSSFEDVLFLDADNLALNDPTTYFESDLYKGFGMILWPDFWEETVSPLFYDIQGTTKPASKYPARTCETGQILISKRRNGKSLLLATYYNVYGPKYFYPLLSQGSPGEGDKETFAAAAIYLKVPYYLVEKKVDPLGFFSKDNNYNFRGQAMLQFDPVDDFDRVPVKQIRPAFIHANFPKFDPYSILDKGVTSYMNSESHRLWQDVHQKGYTIAWGGPDPEPQVWKEMIYIACKIGDKLQYSGKKGVNYCENLKKHYEAVFGHYVQDTPIRQGQSRLR